MKAGTAWLRAGAMCLLMLVVLPLAVLAEDAQSVEELLFGPEIVGPLPEEDVRAVLEKHPDDAALHYAASWYLRGDEGKRALARAIELDPSFEVVAVAQETYRCWGRDESLLRRFAELDPDNALPHYLLSSHALSTKGDPAARLAHLEAALSKPHFRSYHDRDLTAKFALLEKVGANPLRKMALWSSQLLPYLPVTRNGARRIIERGDEKLAGGDSAGALADYRLATRAAGHLLQDEPRLLISKMVARSILVIVERERVALYEQTGQPVELAEATLRLDTFKALRPVAPAEGLTQQLIPLVLLQERQVRWPADELQRALGHSQEFARSAERARGAIREYLASPRYRYAVDTLLRIRLEEGEEGAWQRLWPNGDSGPLGERFGKVAAAVAQLEEAYGNFRGKSARAESYEVAAAGTLRALAAAQSTFVARCIVDQDGDGAGEYGYLQELAGGVIPRTRKVALAPGEVFSSVFGTTDKHGVVHNIGYCYVLFLPTGAGPAARESDGAVPRAKWEDANRQETRWIAYAWPQEHGVTGTLAFAINQQCEVYVCENADGRYSGPEKAPAPGAALAPNEGLERNLDSGFPGPGQKGSDGLEWVRGDRFFPPRRPRRVEHRRRPETIRGMNIYETAAAGTLRSLAAAQATFVARCIVDQDRDGAGEYGYFQELGGGAVPRSRVAALAPGEVFSQSMAKVDARGVAKKSGYCYIIYLPTASGPAVMESASAVPVTEAANANAQEVRWLAYAWPEHFASTGTHCFAVNQEMRVYISNNADGRYNGPENPPKPGAALVPNAGKEQNLGSIFPDADTPASDGQHWIRVEFPR